MNYNGADGLEFGDGNIDLDLNVIRHLPAGCKVLSVEPHGESFWASIGRIDVELDDGSSQAFFIKVLSNTTGKMMLHSEFESMQAIYAVLPRFAPKPIAWGSYSSSPDTHFFLCEFRDMSGDLPDPLEFTNQLATLHSKSQSPDGKFGFHMTTYQGNLPQMVDWDDSWESFFAKNLRKALDLEIEARGYDPEFDELLPVLFDEVVPRLLRPLESEGRTVKPSLVHGDLWFANSGVDIDSGDSLLFDACCFYAHNEYELGQWRPACNRFGDEFFAAYKLKQPPSAPKEDYDGRLDLYKLRFNTHVSALFKENISLRDQMLGDIRDLVKRYGSGGVDGCILA